MKHEYWKRLWLPVIGIGILSFSQTVSRGSEPETILFIGDSITAGYGLDRADAYPALIGEKIVARGLPYEVVNAGVSGDTTSGGLRRIEWVLRGGEPAVVFLALGGNDGLRGVPVETTRKNLSDMVDTIRRISPRSEIVLAGIRMPENMGRNYTEAFFETFSLVAEEKDIHHLPYLLEGVGGDPGMNQEDRIHPNARGQKRIAETVWQKLEPLLFKQTFSGPGPEH